MQYEPPAPSPHPRVFAAAALALATLASLAAAAPAVTHPRCDGVGPVAEFAAGLGVLENLLFDGRGHLYVSAGTRLLRFDPDGASTVVLDGLPSTGGLALDRDGRLHVGIGNGPAGSALRTGEAAVWKLTSVDPPRPEVHAAGFDMANGLAFDDAGNLYVSNDFGADLVRIPAASPAAWERWARLYSANGIAPAGDALYVAVTFDQTSPIVRVPLDDPDGAEEIARLSAGAATLEPRVRSDPGTDAPLAPKGLDDLTLGPDGNLYVAANGAGEVLRVDPVNGTACVVAAGLSNPSSVRFANQFGPHDGAAFVTQFNGAIAVIARPTGE